MVISSPNFSHRQKSTNFDAGDDSRNVTNLAE